MTRRPSGEVDDEAAQWVARIDSGPLSPETEAELKAWLNSNDRCRGAYLRAQAAWAMLDRARALSTGRLSVASDVAPPAFESHAPRYARRRLIAVSGAVMAVLIGGSLGLNLSKRERLQYETMAMEVRRLPLEDGSMVVLNTDSAIEVAMASDVRNVTVLRGEAWFQVAKDYRRPFVVAAGELRVKAVGTAFSVGRAVNQEELLVSQGTVAAWSATVDASATMFTKGQSAILPQETGRLFPAKKNVADRLAWLDGQIALSEDRLTDAARKFNRYNQRQIIIDDAELGDQRIVGLFRLNDPSGFAHAAATSLGGRVSQDGDVIRITTKP